MQLPHIAAELLRELAKIKDLRVAIEGLTSIVSETRDELIRSRHVNEDILQCLRDVRDSL